MTVVTRFAPSPTGFLHIGGARTALFNWLFARRHGGKFLLRIEDTDRKRSTDEAVEAIHDGLKWLELDWDGDAVSQFSRVERHQAEVERLLEAGHAYRCYRTPEELADMREKARSAGRGRFRDGRWRDRDPLDAPKGVRPAIRLKAPLDGETVIEDAVQGRVTVANDQLDDMILMRADGVPTYMLAVVVDDHDMGVTHVIRGDDHLTNAFRQTQLFKALGYHVPTFAHIPLIHGADGAKMSKRHGALGVDAYRDMGFLPEAVTNYLMRLGWSHGDDEVISRAQAVEWFDLNGVGKAAARFDMDKLNHLNGLYIRNTDDERLADLVLPLIQQKLGGDVSPGTRERLIQGMPGLKERAKNIVDLAENAEFYAYVKILLYEEKAARQLTPEGLTVMGAVREALASDDQTWEKDALMDRVRAVGEEAGLKLGKVAGPLRSALTGRAISPSVFEIMTVLGRSETLARLDAAQRDPTS